MEGKHEPLEFKQQVLSKISPSFCASKFLTGTVWLGSGFTASCHHCAPDPILKSEAAACPSKIFNTQRKAESRSKMLRGERPSECEYCWSVEEHQELSDRVYSSGMMRPEDILRLKTLAPTSQFIPKMLEIAFDRVCQFACSYCGPQYSTRWRNDVQKAGPYNIRSDISGQFNLTCNEKFAHEEGENPYVKAFWQWWPELKMNLEELRLTGGEPLLSPETWRLLDEVATKPVPGLKLALNSNLGVPEQVMERLISVAEQLPHLSIYTSCEAYGPQAEYIREGLEFERWKGNVEGLLAVEKLHKLVVTMTVNALSLASMTQLLDEIMAWRRRFGRLKVQFSINLLKWPKFQTVQVLPELMRLQKAEEVQTWMARHSGEFLTGHETDGLHSLIHALLDMKVNRTELGEDFKKFFSEYDSRRGKNFESTFDPSWQKWYGGLNV